MINESVNKCSERRQLTSNRRAILWSLVFLFLTLVVAWILAKDIPDLQPALRRIAYHDLVFALLLVLGNYFLRIQRWRFYLFIVKQKLTFIASALAFTTGLAGSLTPGKAGELIRCFSASRFGVPWPVTLATLGVERISDLLVVTGLALSGALAANNHQFTSWVVLIFACLAMIFMILRQGNLRKLVSRIPLFGKRLAYNSPDVFWAILQKSHTGRVLWVTLSIGTIGWFLEVVCLWLIAQSIDASLSLSICSAAFGFGILAGALSMIPGGLGTTETVMTTILVWSGCTLVDSIVIIIVFRFCTLWFGVSLGIIASLWQTISTVLHSTKRGI